MSENKRGAANPEASEPKVNERLTKRLEELRKEFEAKRAELELKTQEFNKYSQAMQTELFKLQGAYKEIEKLME